MRSAAVTTIWFLLLNIGLAQVNPLPALPPTPLEAFAARPTARVTWSKVIGHLESEESRATITAIIIEDKTSAQDVVRGIRVDLAHLGATPRCEWKYEAWRIMCGRAEAAVYIEEGRLAAVRAGLRRGVAQLRPMEFISQYRMTAPGRPSSGLIVCGYQFSGGEPKKLAELFTRGIAELEAAPRWMAAG